MAGRLRRFFSLLSVRFCWEIPWDLAHLSQASCAHAYGRAISSSGFKEWATLRDRASRDSARSMSSGGSGPDRVGMRPVKACSVVALLMLRGDVGATVELT